MLSKRSLQTNLQSFCSQANALPPALSRYNMHSVKSVRIRTYSGPYFPTFGLNTERYGVFSPNAGKYGPEKLRIQTLSTQCLSQINLQFMWSYFIHKSLPRNIRKGSIFNLPRITYNGTNAVYFGGSLIWNNFAVDINSRKSLCEFKRKIKDTPI